MPLGSLKGEPNTENLNTAASLGFSDPRLQVVLPSKPSTQLAARVTQFCLSQGPGE